MVSSDWQLIEMIIFFIFWDFWWMNNNNLILENFGIVACSANRVKEWAGWVGKKGSYFV